MRFGSVLQQQREICLGHLKIRTTETKPNPNPNTNANPRHKPTNPTYPTDPTNVTKPYHLTVSVSVGAAEISMWWRRGGKLHESQSVLSTMYHRAVNIRGGLRNAQPRRRGALKLVSGLRGTRNLSSNLAHVGVDVRTQTNDRSSIGSQSETSPTRPTAVLPATTSRSGLQQQQQQTRCLSCT